MFTLALNVTTGAWTFTLLNPIDDAQGGAENSASLDLSGLVQAVDFDGDATTLSGDFTITVKDDVPVLDPAGSNGAEARPKRASSWPRWTRLGCARRVRAPAD